MTNNNEIIYKNIVKGIKEFFHKHEFKKAVIGLSGGIDSSLSAKLVADAISKENVYGFILPYKGISSEHSVDDAIHLSRLINISHKIFQINEIVKKVNETPWDKTKIADMNTLSRIRSVILYNFANSYDALVIGTSNKTELNLGYFTKYGDGACDVEVIGDLYKTQVWELAKFLDLPRNIINKKPSAELTIDQFDEDDLGLSYKEIDQFLTNPDKSNIDNGRRKNLLQRIYKNKHKLDMPLIIKSK